EKKYPLVVYIYGMPGVPTIRDSWAGSRYLFHQFLVQEGYVVAQIDDRTSAIWGHKYAVLGDHNIGPLAVADHEAAVEYLTSLPYVDARNTAVWGWSGGGFTTTFHMTHTKLFKIGVAGAPVTDWHLYDSIYTERYMGTPWEDPEAYRRTSSVEAVANFEGRMLLIHGTHDDNVHPQNSIQLIDGLIKNRKQFDQFFYPNKTHGIRGTDEVIHLWTMVFEYMERHLK
ncbi:MAG TPA: prolyl oligopeptidase family serine peptidase, partial [Vicinamibacteria bacterium]|nr:prolyl oligopeptidase family serine peptidase [Vicinamibacteria bacterium]